VFNFSPNLGNNFKGDQRNLYVIHHKTAIILSSGNADRHTIRLKQEVDRGDFLVAEALKRGGIAW
jgi:hypothetical protein